MEKNILLLNINCLEFLSMEDNNNTASIQFFRGINEEVIPEIRLSRNKDGRKGRAYFLFDQTEAISVTNISEIKSMIMLDGEGELTTRNINIRTSDGKNQAIEAIYTWNSDIGFQRFMRFANSYAKTHDLGYSKK